MRVVAPRVLDVGIPNQSSDGALSSWHIPHTARQFVHDGADMRRIALCQFLQPQVVGLHRSEQAVGLRLCSEEHAIETHPFRPSQGTRLHVVSRLDDGDAEMLQSAIATAVLERRQEQGIGLQVEDDL